MNKSPDTVWHPATVTRDRRAPRHGHKSAIVWFTGLSGAGKSTLAHAVEAILFQNDCRTYVLDGDNVRHGLCADLGFSSSDRTENIRRVGEVAKLFVDAGIIVLAAFISPFQADRDRVRHQVPAGDFIEVHCDCSIDVCEERDVKGLYGKARSGLVKDFTGVSSPYEAPRNPELVIDTANTSLDDSVVQILETLKQHEIIPPTLSVGSMFNLARQDSPGAQVGPS